MKITKILTRSLLVAGAITALAMPVVGTLDANAAGFAQLVHSGEAAGYQAGDPTAPAPWHFRYVQGDVKLPDVTKETFAGYGVSARLSNATEQAVLGLSTTPAAGKVYNALFNLEGKPNVSGVGGCVKADPASIPAGDTVRFALFYDYNAGVISGGVTDLTANTNWTFSCTDPGDGFTRAHIGTEYGSWPWDTVVLPAPTGPHVLVGITNTIITNRTGIRGSAGVGPWLIQRQEVMTKGGFQRAVPTVAGGSSAVSPDNVVRQGRNFSVVLLG